VCDRKKKRQERNGLQGREPQPIQQNERRTAASSAQASKQQMPSFAATAPEGGADRAAASSVASIDSSDCGSVSSHTTVRTSHVLVVTPTPPKKTMTNAPESPPRTVEDLFRLMLQRDGERDEQQRQRDEQQRLRDRQMDGLVRQVNALSQQVQALAGTVRGLEQRDSPAQEPDNQVEQNHTQGILDDATNPEGPPGHVDVDPEEASAISSTGASRGSSSQGWSSQGSASRGGAWQGSDGDPAS
jgi:hypothetical protein